MPSYDSRRSDAYREPRGSEPRRRRAMTGVVIIDDDISWSTVPRRPRRISGPVSGDPRGRERRDARDRRDERDERAAWEAWDERDPYAEELDAQPYGRSEREVTDVSDELHRWVAEGAATGELGSADPAVAAEWTPSSYGSSNGERRTVVITGRGADRYLPVRRGGYESSLRRHERSTFRPDRVAMWAVLLGVLLVLIAATSSHAATLAVHLPH
jgi:hypothetical protein